MNRASSRNISASVSAASKHLSWAWLNALAHDLPIAAGVIDAQGELTLVTTLGTSAANGRLERAARAAAFKAAAGDVLGASKPRRLSVEGLDLLLAHAQVDRVSAVIAVAVESEFSSTAPRLLEGLAGAVRAQLAQTPDEDFEAFDRVSSLHRLLHETVERGNETDVVTAFAEAVFAWDGVEVSGYVHDVDGHWTLSLAAPGATRGHQRVPTIPSRETLGTISPLDEHEAAHFGFDRSRDLLGVTLGGPAVDPWLLIFAEGFGPLRESSARLYIDLLREALGRTAAIAETRASWAIIQQLLGAGAAETVAAAALTELARALGAAGASITATAPSGAVVLSAGDDEAHGPVRPFGRVTRLASTTQLTEGYAIDLTVRRGPGETFTRREQHMLDRLSAIFSAWLSRAVKQGTVQKDRRAEHRDFDQVLDRAAAQALRDGTDVSVMVISAPEASARPALIRSWVVELRSRLRGSDLAGALSDREIGLMLCGTTPDNIDHVRNRLVRHLKFGEQGNPMGVVGTASRVAGQVIDGSLVSLARRNLDRRALVGGEASR